MGEFDKTLGVLLIGVIFNTYLYGLVSYQFIIYKITKFNDPVWTKSIVAALFAMDTFHSTVAIYMAWIYCVDNFTNPSIISVALWPYTFTPIGTAVTSFLTQIFLVHRIKALTGSATIFYSILFLATVTCGLGMTSGVKAWIIKEISGFSVLKTIVTWWLGMQIGLDTLITGILSYVLLRSRTGVKSTDTIIKRLVRTSVQTGLFVTVFSLGDLISFLCVPNLNLHGMFAIPIGRIYTNTLLDTLNMRLDLKKAAQGTNFGGISRDIRFQVPDENASFWAGSISTNESHTRQTDVELPGNAELTGSSGDQTKYGENIGDMGDTSMGVMSLKSHRDST